MTVKAITFDLWDTLVRDNTDEPRRAQAGLRSKPAERRHLVWAALNGVEPIELEPVSLAYDTADAAFSLVWHELHITWNLDQLLGVVLGGLGRELPPDTLAGLIDEIGRMEVDIPPDVIEGAAEALAELSRSYKLAVVSDTITTPGTGLRQLLEGHGLAGYFSAFAFSDEVGHSKPHRDMFASAAGQLGVGLDEIIHIGDRDHNDIKGPQALGAMAILFTASRAHDAATTTADAVCASYAELPAAIARLAAS